LISKLDLDFRFRLELDFKIFYFREQNVQKAHTS